MDMNRSNNINFILVQIPESVKKDSDAYKLLGHKTIADITIDRMMRAGKVVSAEASELIKKEQGEIDFEEEHRTKMPDVGFRVFKLCKSSFPRTDFAPDPEKSEEENLELFRKYVATKEQQLSMVFDDHELITEILISHGFMLTYKLELQPSLQTTQSISLLMVQKRHTSALITHSVILQLTTLCRTPTQSSSA